MAGLGPRREGQQDTGPFRQHQQVMGELQRGRVGPVEVFDRDNRRPTRRQRFDEDPNASNVRCGRGRTTAQGLLVEMARMPARRLGGTGAAIGRHRLERLQGRSDLVRRRARTQPQPSLEQVLERLVGHGLPERGAACLQPQGRLRVGTEPDQDRPQLREDPALPIPPRRSRTASHPGPKGAAWRPSLEAPALGIPADERGTQAAASADARGADADAADLVGHDRFGLALQRQRPRLRPVEQRRNDPLRGCSHHHSPGAAAP